MLMSDCRHPVTLPVLEAPTTRRIQELAKDQWGASDCVGLSPNGNLECNLTNKVAAWLKPMPHVLVFFPAVSTPNQRLEMDSSWKGLQD